MPKKTIISDSIFVEEKNDEIDEESLSKSIIDLSLTLEARIKAINMFYTNEGRDETIEILTRLCTMYEMSGTKLLRQYLFAICEQSELEPFLKSFSAKSLHSYDDKDDLAYKAIDLVYPQLGPDIGTPYKVNILKMLMVNDDYKQCSRDHLCNTINDQRINCDYRYKVILGLEYKPEQQDEKLTRKELEKIQRYEAEQKQKYNWFIREACLEFLNEKNNEYMYRILSSQYLLQHCTISADERTMVENILLGFARDTDLEYDLRADATDVLLQLSEGQTKEQAQEIIMELGRNNRVVRTVYDNAQNVHTKEIESSVLEAIEFLHTFDILKIGPKHNRRYIDMKHVENEIMEMKMTDERQEKVKVSINRIYMDRVIYSKYSCTLSHILLRVWTYIIGHTSEDAMKERLLEELEEMAGTCSSGFISRLINTISGFGDFSMRISWRDQIVSNLTGRLNKRIREMDNYKLQEKVLEQMTLETDKYEQRKHFLKFLRRNVLAIREEMYEEFKSHIDDTEFDMYFRRAISMYETGQFV